MGAVATIFRKELMVEYRNKQSIVTFVLLVLLILISFRFAFSDVGPEDTELAAPIIWTAIFLSGLHSLTPIYRREVEEGTKEGLLLAPVERQSIYLGKLAASMVVTLGLAGLSLLLFFVFFQFDYPDMLVLGVILALGIVGFVTLGTIMSAISANLSQAGVMLMVLSIPLLLFTVVLTAVSATSEIFAGGGLSDVESEGRLLVVFSLAYFAIGYILIDFILEA